MLAGICGVTLYFLFENIALTLTMASNVGVIVAISPFFTALFSRVINPGQPLQPRFFLGFLLAIGGIACISFNGQALQFNPAGDLLCRSCRYCLVTLYHFNKKNRQLRSFSAANHPSYIFIRSDFYGACPVFYGFSAPMAANHPAAEFDEYFIFRRRRFLPAASPAGTQLWQCWAQSKLLFVFISFL